MTYDDFSRHLRSALTQGLASRMLSNVDVKQGNQLQESYRTSNPTIYFFSVSNRRYGFMGEIHQFNSVNGNMDTTERQYRELKMQFMCVTEKQPTDLVSPSSKDILSAAANILNSPSGISALRQNGIGVLRITDERSSFFENDRDRYEDAPSFDASFSFVEDFETTTEVVSTSDIDCTINRL